MSLFESFPQVAKPERDPDGVCETLAPQILTHFGKRKDVESLTTGDGSEPVIPDEHDQMTRPKNGTNGSRNPERNTFDADQI